MEVQEIKKQFEDIFKQMEPLIGDDPKKQKALALARNTVDFADELVSLAKLISKRKRIFQKIDRRPKNKIQRRIKIFSKIINLRLLQMQQLMIMQTPIPKNKFYIINPYE